MTKKQILHYLADVKKIYAKEGLIIEGLFGSYSRDEARRDSDIDVLVNATPDFAARYGFRAIARIREIEEEMGRDLGLKVDLADKSGMGKTGKKFIIDKTIYV